MRMGLFGDLDVRIDPWQVDYGSELPIDAGEESEAGQIALDVEVAPSDWAPIVPRDAGAVPPPLLFVDGVRRVDVRLLVGLADGPCHGAFASYAVGAVAITEGVASFAAERVDRIAVVGAGRLIPAPIAVRPGLAYRPVSTAETDPDAPVVALQTEMRAAEGQLVLELAGAGDALIVADGPLGFADPSARAVGFIKRISTMYLPAPLIPLLGRLPSRSRTPLFLIRSRSRFARYAWFARLADPARADSSYAGVVRLEVPDAIGADAARLIADTTTAVLPRLVPSRARDPRAPQNLLPIGALESRLRHRLGDAQLVRRQIEALIAGEATQRAKAL
jgi:hypothetical protein